MIYKLYQRVFIILIEQDMQEKTEVIRSDLLMCPRLRPAKLICASSSCQKNSFMCLDQSCQICSKEHQQCQIYKLSKVVVKLNAKKQQTTPEIDKAIEAMEKVYDQAIQKISICKQYARGQMLMFGYHQGQLQFLQKINQGLIQEINGKITSKMIATLNVQLQFNADQQLINQFWQKKKPQFQKIFDNFKALPNKEISKLISLIVKEPEDITFIESTFKGQLILRYEKLYRASQNNFSAAAFHMKCDGKANTLVIASTNHGRIIGGFTRIPWNSNSNYLNDGQAIIGTQNNKMKSFLFSVSLKQKYPCIDGTNAIYGNSGYGPTFGSGHDFYIADVSNSNSNSYFNFPYSYNTEDRKYTNGAQSFQSFSGSPDGQYSAQILQWEVFQIQFA